MQFFLRFMSSSSDNSIGVSLFETFGCVCCVSSMSLFFFLLFHNLSI